MNKLRWGVLSTANIGMTKVLPAMLRGERCEIVAIASRDEATARAAAAQLGIPKAYGTYEALLADPEIDAVYNPLPNHLHVPWSIKAIEAGKHVLCEKPIGLSAVEARELVAVAAQYPHLKTISSFFSYYNDDPTNIRNRAEVGGGGLMDIGCYNISLSRFIFDAEPTRVLGIVEYDPRFGTDRLASGILDFGRGTATFTCATQLSPYQRANIHGTQGRVEIEIPVNAPPDAPCRIWHQRGGAIEEIVLDPVDQYMLQGDRFAAAVLNDTPVPTPLADAVANMRVIEALVASARDDAWVTLA